MSGDGFGMFDIRFTDAEPLPFLELVPKCLASSLFHEET